MHEGGGIWVENQELNCWGSIFSNKSWEVVDLGSGDPVVFKKTQFEGVGPYNWMVHKGGGLVGAKNIN